MDGSVLEALVLGVVQGVSEFAPVSSSGHLVVIPWAFGWSMPSLAFDTMLHLGTLAAVIVYFRTDLARVAAGLVGRGATERVKTYRRLGLLLVIGTIPAMVIGYLFEDLFERMFANPPAAGAFFLITGAWLVVAERLGRRRSFRASAALARRSALGSCSGCGARRRPGSRFFWRYR